MPERQTARRAKSDLRHGRSPSTAAGEFVGEEMRHIRRGKHGARSSKQAIAIGLSKARRAGVPLPAPKGGRRSVRKAAERDLTAAQAQTETVAGRAVARRPVRSGTSRVVPHRIVRSQSRRMSPQNAAAMQHVPPPRASSAHEGNRTTSGCSEEGRADARASRLDDARVQGSPRRRCAARAGAASLFR